MSEGLAMLAGLTLGLLIAACCALVVCGAYVSSDMDAFRRWVDGI